MNVYCCKPHFSLNTMGFARVFIIRTYYRDVLTRLDVTYSYSLIFEIFVVVAVFVVVVWEELQDQSTSVVHRPT